MGAPSKVLLLVAKDARSRTGFTHSHVYLDFDRPIANALPSAMTILSILAFDRGKYCRLWGPPIGPIVAIVAQETFAVDLARRQAWGHLVRSSRLIHGGSSGKSPSEPRFIYWYGSSCGSAKR
jgi:hypothetical protein